MSRLQISEEKHKKIDEEIQKMLDKNNGKLPRGATSELAEICGVSYPTIKLRLERKGYSQIGRPKISHGVEYQEEDTSPKKKDNPKDIKMYLNRLEGAVEGFRPFHPRLAQYMTEQLNALYRIWNIQNDNKFGWEKLDGKSKEGWEDIDKEITLNDIRDNMAVKDLV